jgi:hypothetical protein
MVHCNVFPFIFVLMESPLQIIMSWKEDVSKFIFNGLYTKSTFCVFHIYTLSDDLHILNYFLCTTCLLNDDLHRLNYFLCTTCLLCNENAGYKDLGKNIMMFLFFLMKVFSPLLLFVVWRLHCCWKVLESVWNPIYRLWNSTCIEETTCTVIRDFYRAQLKKPEDKNEYLMRPVKHF